MCHRQPCWTEYRNKNQYSGGWTVTLEWFGGDLHLKHILKKGLKLTLDECRHYEKSLSLCFSCN